MAVSTGAPADRELAEISDLTDLRAASAGCTRCPLHRDATQIVFGDGPPNPAMVLVGEQPGDQEDQQGAPFVGPAGGLLDRALREAGISKQRVYLTNAVKHFKFEQRGKRRIHQRPTAGEIRSCRPWLDAELRLLRPRLVVVLGATAAKALLGSTFRLTEQRGELLHWTPDQDLIATVHPSAVLRTPHGQRTEKFQGFVRDLKAAGAAALG